MIYYDTLKIKMSIESEDKNSAPYVGFPITASCAFECSYCTPGGETAPSEIPVFDKDLLLETARTAYELGSRKFRITGGEPFMHPELGSILFGLSEYQDTQTTVNTTGIPLIDRQGILTNTPENVHFVVSLDSLKPEVLQIIRPSRIPNYRERILQSITELSNKGILKRLNMVVTKYNVDEVFDILRYCEEIGTDLKIADVAENKDQNLAIDDVYVPIDGIEVQLRSAADYTEEHVYSQNHGIPSNIYHVNGVGVTVKNSKNGSRYNPDANYCGNCEYYPCHEGLYFISALPDGSFSTCRLNQIQPKNNNQKEALSEMFTIIENSRLEAGKK